MGGRKPLDLVVQAVAEDPVGEGGGRRVGLVAPTHHRGLGRAAGVAHVAADDVGQFLDRTRDYVGHPVQDGDFGRFHHRRRQVFKLGVGNKLGQGSGCAHGLHTSQVAGITSTQECYLYYNYYNDNRLQ